ncbi:MAG: hypothetical protein N3A01_06945 [Bacteroidales bacterium]|nr:hypothetical protein [Bacteroidales bacterium]
MKKNLKNKPNNKLAIPLIVLVTFLYYFNTIFNKYALDDIVVITKNKFTQNGIKGIYDILTNDMFTGYYGKKQDLVSGNRYRPLPMITFAIEKELFNNNPHISHFFNVLLFAVLNVLLFIVLNNLFESLNQNNVWYLSFPFIATILFVSHPIHTEAIANIKGRDEILSLLFSLITFHYSLKYTTCQKKKFLFIVFLSFIFAMFSKEISAVFLLLIPLSLWFFREIEIKKIIKIFFVLLMPFIIYLTIRAIVLSAPSEHVGYSSLINNSFLEMNLLQKYSTIFYVIALYIKLLFIPYPLTSDYYPYHVPIVEPYHLRFIVSFILICFLFYITLKHFKKKSVYSFSIIFFFVAIFPVSNILFPIGTFMSERFLFIPSIAFCITIGNFYSNYLLNKIKNQGIPKILICLLLIIYLIITLKRNEEWHDNFTLFSKDIKTSKNSAWGNLVYGSVLLEKAEEAYKSKDSLTAKKYLEQCFPYLYKALKIYPDYLEAYLHLGAAYYYYNKNYDSIIWAYTNVVRIDKNYDLAYWNFEIVFKNYNDYNKMIKTYEKLFQYNPHRFEVNYMLGFLYGKYKNDLEKSLYYLNRAYRIKNNDKQLLKDLGVAYGLKAKFDSSLFFFRKSIVADSNDAQSYLNMAITFYNINYFDSALFYYKKAKQKNASLHVENFEKLLQ